MSNGRHQTVKSILQDEQVPPWWRQRMPLVYHANTLWAVGDLRLHPDFRDWLRDNNARLCWTPPELCPPCQGAIDTP